MSHTYKTRERIVALRIPISQRGMAYDLATTPSTGLRVQACGDCHLLNFGLFATPERNLVFDINDFDETLPAPWEWDVKRLAVSFAVRTPSPCATMATRTSRLATMPSSACGLTGNTCARIRKRARWTSGMSGLMRKL